MEMNFILIVSIFTFFVWYPYLKTVYLNEVSFSIQKENFNLFKNDKL